MPEIGATLREARMRARIDVSEIEAQTKIRAKYLRALENEEWGLLPGPTFVKSFLRTYAQALDLDGKALVEEYRLHHEHPSEAMLEPIVSTPQSARPRGRPGPGERSSRGFVIAVSAIGVVIVVLVVLLIAGGSPSKTTTSTSTGVAARGGASRSKHGARGSGAHHGAVSPSATVALSLKASAVDYVCLIGDDGAKLVPGIELQPGESTQTYRARRFELTLGNNAVTMFVDGIPRTVPPSSQAIGYSITKAYGRQLLPAGRLPTCT
jgi:cytoskeleton protein RodZ